MSTPVENDNLVGATRAYVPAGFAWSPVDPTPDKNTIMCSGDIVTVESAWGRDYLENAPLLYYVTSHRTGQKTHVTAGDLVTLSA